MVLSAHVLTWGGKVLIGAAERLSDIRRLINGPLRPIAHPRCRRRPRPASRLIELLAWTFDNALQPFPAKLAHAIRLPNPFHGAA